MLVKKSLHSLTGKLLLTIGTLMIVGSTIFWYFLFRHQEKELIDGSVKYAYSFVDYVKKSTHYGMLTAHKVLIQQTIEAIGASEGVLDVRIFDCKAKIAYSTKTDEAGTTIDPKGPSCTGCHVSGQQ